mmetsp:Transcript_31093/g.75684  ORF Transcript_31093/g.75684 Transcript_31093/m.75684 type:complete len:581 (+) Transcript_31093:76-1818(+)
MAAGHGFGKPFRVELPIRSYVEYSTTNQVDWPFYSWERKWDGARRSILEDFTAPKAFADDLYDTTEETREFLPLSCHLFVLIGGRRTGSNVHQDPKWSSAWNTVLCGSKRWVLFPPSIPPEVIGALGDYRSGGPPLYWWLDTYRKLREDPSNPLGMVDVVQRPHDTIFIPSGWWHAVLNIPGELEGRPGVTVCCTRNAFLPESLPRVLPLMRVNFPAFADLFVSELRSRRPDLARFLPAEQESKAAEDVPDQIGCDPTWMLHRRRCAGLSLAECRRRYISQGHPLIITGLQGVWASKESLGCAPEWLKEHFGEKRLAAYTNFGANRAAQAADSSDLVRLADAMDRVQQGEEGLYVYDVSLPLQMPALLEHVFLPRYFAHDYLQQTMRKHCFSKSWPTFFLGAQGSHSSLHVDQWRGHFWMMLLKGSKHWTIFHPEDVHLLSPLVREGSFHPKFPSLEDVQESEGYQRARRLEVVLQAGEVLFVPGGAPHFVKNLTDTMAIAGNFVDESNLQAVLEDLKSMVEAGSGGEALKEFYTAMDEVEFEEGLSMHEEVLRADQLVVRYGDFVGGRAAHWPAEPPLF